MSRKTYFFIWGGLFILCACLGFIPAPEGALKWVMVALCLAFFVPPAILAARAAKEKDRAMLRLLRNLSMLSLGLTVAALIGNFLTLMASEALGNALHALLVIVSTPMICGQYWLLSLFCWAFLMVFCVTKLRRKKH